MARKLPSTMKWQQYAVVTATFASGVLDSLRYDRACPCTSEDAALLEEFLGNRGEYRSITFVVTRWSEDKNSLWTEDRWRSFQMQIRPIDNEHEVERQLVKREVK